MPGALWGAALRAWQQGRGGKWTGEQVPTPIARTLPRSGGEISHGNVTVNLLFFYGESGQDGVSYLRKKSLSPGI